MINCTAVQLMIFRMKTNKMADRYLNANSNFVTLIVNKQRWLFQFTMSKKMTACRFYQNALCEHPVRKAGKI